MGWPGESAGRADARSTQCRSQYAFIDETGDAGLKFDRNSSTHFVIAVVTDADREAIERAALEVRDRLRWSMDHEFHFSDTNDAARLVYLGAMRRISFRVHAMIFDKRKLSPTAARKDFYGELVALSLEDILEVLRGARLVLDESFRGKAKKRTFRTELRSRLSRPEGRVTIGNLTYESSASNDVLQLADMVVGAIGRVYKRGDSQFRTIIESKIVTERHYP